MYDKHLKTEAFQLSKKRLTVIASADGCQAAEAPLLTTITAPVFPIPELPAVTFIH